MGASEPGAADAEPVEILGALGSLMLENDGHVCASTRRSTARRTSPDSMSAVARPTTRWSESSARPRLRHDGLGLLEGLDGLAVARAGQQRLALREQRLGACELRGLDAVREVARVGLEARGEPVDRLLRRARLAALDLTDVLLGEARAGELGLRSERPRRAAGEHALRAASRRSSGCA